LVERVDSLSKRVRKEVSVSLEDNTRIVQKIHPLWNNREFDRILSEMIAEDIEWTTVPTGETFRGHEGFRQFMQGWADAFPDSTTEDTIAYAGEEFGVTEFIGRGTHDGPLVSPAGEIPPTGRSVEFKLCEVYQFRDGKVVSGHTHFDSLGLMTHLGVVPPPGQGGS
jgi:ketosteroid isomerase-like protein